MVVRRLVFHGGVERATMGLLAALAERGHEVHVASPGPPAALAGVTVHRLPVPRLPPTARLLALAVAARVVALRGGWDVVQSHERTLGQDVYRAGEGCHAAYLASREARRGRGLYHAVLLGLERRTFARTPRVVAISRQGAEEIARLHRVPPERLAVVYNGVDLERFHPRWRARDRAGARAEAGVPCGAWTLLFVGSGYERKGLATVLSALARLPEREARLLVVGKGSEAAHRALAARLGLGARVAWLGPRPDVERWYAAADALALPAWYEPFGNVHLEALACGVPVVTSTRAGGREVVQPDVTGAIVEPGDPAALAAALARVRGLTGEVTTAAARAAAEPFTYAAQVVALERIYRSLGASVP